MPFRPVAKARGLPFLAGEGRVCVRWSWRQADAAVVGEVYFGPHTEGPPGHVHGGALTSVLDEAMSLSCFMQKRMVLAARLEVDMRAALRLDTLAMVIGRVERVEGRKCFTAATLSVEQTLHAECKGLFISLGASPG